MAMQQPRLVNKQFNSPIGLYSESNVKEILERETQMLSNGAIGINFHNPMISKPANLHNSAVLRMLEEEESRQRNGHAPGGKRVAWPPPRDSDELASETPVQTEGGSQFNQPQNNINQTVVPVNRTATAPQPFNQKAVATTNNPTTTSSAQARPWAPVQSQIYQPQQTPPLQSKPTQQPSFAQPQSPSIQQQQKPAGFSSPYYNAAAPTTPPYQVTATPQQSQQQQQTQPTLYQPPSQVKQVEPPPTVITLRQQVPTRQAPAPVFNSQPATATLKGGKHLRGDLKWPPENVRERMEAENRARMELAKGPAVRPRRVDKDYSPFFAQHALNSTYPGYKVPPGTQYYEHHPVL